MNFHLESSDIPSSVDWREKGVVPPVVNQGHCGDSGMYPIVDSVDSFWAIEHGHLVLASYEEYIDCCLMRNGNDGCHGGLLSSAGYQCIVQLGGLASESEYQSTNRTCLSAKYPPVVKISGSRDVVPRNEEALAVAVARQPISVAIDASHQSFQLYNKGIYYNPLCSSTRLDHSVLVVGYGSLNGEDYWIIKNSWGKA